MKDKIVLSFEEKPGAALSYLKLVILRRKGLKPGELLPDISAQWKDASVDGDNLARYRKACSLNDDGSLPLLYPHVLASPLYMAMLSHGSFPIPLIGSLHLRNHIIQHRPVGAGERFDLDICLGGKRSVRQGIEFDFTILLSRGGERLWESVTTWLKQGRSGEEIDPSPMAGIIRPIPDAPRFAESYIPKNIGKRYASITGDYNPIHMSRLAARLFGLKRDIAHAMWACADALGRLPALPGDSPRRIDFAFKGPLFLDNPVHITKMDHEGGYRFDIYCGGNTRPSVQADYHAVKKGTVLFH